MVSAEELLERVWDEAADPFTTAVKTTIRRLRAKLGDPPVIQTVRDGGYRIGAGLMLGRLPGSNYHRPRLTLRVRLGLLYAGLFLASGIALLVVIGLLVGKGILYGSSSQSASSGAPGRARPSVVRHRARRRPPCSSTRT